MQKKLMLILGMLLVTSLLAFAAGGKEAGPSGPVTISIWHGYTETEEKTLHQAVTDFMAANPKITVDLLAVPFDQLQNKFQTEAAAGGGPTLVVGPQDRMAAYNQAGLLATLDDTASFIKDLVPAAVNGGRIGGKLLGIPVNNKVVALIYNKSLVTKEPATYDELMADVAKSGFALTADWFHNYMWAPAFSATFLDASNKAVLDSEAGVKAYAFFLQFAKSPGVIADSNDGNQDTLFRQGKVAFRIQGPWASGDYIKDLGAANVGVMAFPAVPGGSRPRPWNQSEMFSINANATKDQVLASGLFLAYFTSAPIQKRFLDAANWIPANSKVDTASNPVVGGFLKQVVYSDPFPVVAELSTTWDPMGNAVTQILEKVKSPKDALTGAMTLINTANKK
jgi:arabinogalactan oligomer / maltooligosaccharide transport system substrate-binding protein